MALANSAAHSELRFRMPQVNARISVIMRQDAEQKSRRARLLGNIEHCLLVLLETLTLVVMFDLFVKEVRKHGAAPLWHMASGIHSLNFLSSIHVEDVLEQCGVVDGHK